MFQARNRFSPCRRTVPFLEPFVAALDPDDELGDREDVLQIPQDGRHALARGTLKHRRSSVVFPYRRGPTSRNE
jgi:hypothetical protein